MPSLCSLLSVLFCLFFFYRPIPSSRMNKSRTRPCEYNYIELWVRARAGCTLISPLSRGTEEPFGVGIGWDFGVFMSLEGYSIFRFCHEERRGQRVSSAVEGSAFSMESKGRTVGQCAKYHQFVDTGFLLFILNIYPDEKSHEVGISTDFVNLQRKSVEKEPFRVYFHFRVKHALDLLVKVQTW